MSGKRGNGEGTLYHNGRYWVGQVTIGSYSDLHKSKRKSVYGRTRKEAQEKMNQVKYLYAKRGTATPTELYVSDWAEQWLNLFQKPRLAPSTYWKQLNILQVRILPALGHIRLCALSAIDIQKLLNSLQDEGLSDGYIGLVYARIHTMLKQAVRLALLPSDPCTGVALPQSGRVKKVSALNRDEQMLLSQHCGGRKEYRLFLFLLGTGMRIGEALALDWSHVHFDEGMIDIRRTITDIRGHTNVSLRTKTEAGLRRIPMSPKIASLLRQQYAEQDQSRNAHALCFPSGRYTYAQSGNIRTRFKRCCQEAGLRPVNLHTLRHTFATRAMEQNINMKLLSYILGHKDIRTTLNTYSHVLHESAQGALDGLDAFW